MFIRHVHAKKRFYNQSGRYGVYTSDGNTIGR